jgi:hypothetical protein
LQQGLNIVDSSGLTVDGIFVAATNAAVKSLQPEYNLMVDGIVGPQTWGWGELDYLLSLENQSGGGSGDTGNDPNWIPDSTIRSPTHPRIWGVKHVDVIIEKFSNKAIERGGIYFFNAADAMNVIKGCRELGSKILGIDAFQLTENMTQPVLEHSIDFTLNGMSGKGNWSEASDFISERLTHGLMFEIIFTS